MNAHNIKAKLIETAEPTFLIPDWNCSRSWHDGNFWLCKSRHLVI